LFKRCVRGMIPWTTSSGRDAYRRLHVFVGTPKQFEDVEKERPAEACRKITGKYTTLGAVSKFLGSNVR
ncbi:MAG: 50S ribosomal protein L13, partial [Candidatus Methanomethylophilaceae archaeon]|nr:50S ribosomal protein L13 [Candidatus Methanomethylophilaceae archaeon]